VTGQGRETRTNHRHRALRALSLFTCWSCRHQRDLRCGKRYALDRTKSLARRISGVAVATGSLIAGSLFFAVTANDMYRLGVGG